MHNNNNDRVFFIGERRIQSRNITLKCDESLNSFFVL